MTYMNKDFDSTLLVEALNIIGMGGKFFTAAELWHEKGVTEENDERWTRSDESKLNITFVHQFIINHLARTTFPLSLCEISVCSERNSSH